MYSGPKRSLASVRKMGMHHGSTGELAETRRVATWTATRAAMRRGNCVSFIAAAATATLSSLSEGGGSHVRPAIPLQRPFEAHRRIPAIAAFIFASLLF